MQQVAEEAGIECNFDTEHQVISYPEGELIKRFEIINPVLEADGMINLAKLKTHGFTLMTGAVKNIFGVIPGLAKPGYHAKLHDRDRFADMLLDLCTYVAPRLSFLDAVIGMEGDGPSAGAPRKLGLLLASANPLALDIVAGEIMGLEEKDNPLLVQARKQGMHPSTFEEVEVVGMEKENLRVADFTLPSVIQSGTGINAPAWIQNIMQALLKNGVTAKPVILRDTCTGCGVCMKACPMDTITLTSDNKATIEYDNCIRCYCCHEMCPEKAIELRHGLLYKLFARK
jgi:ferredoxin